jgi:hypothetical protein
VLEQELAELLIGIKLLTVRFVQGDQGPLQGHIEYRDLEGITAK